MSSFYEDASLVMIPSGYKTSKVYCAKPTDGAGDLTFTRSNDTATRVASNGLIEKVRTNLLLQSQAFGTAPWGTQIVGTGVTPVITQNNATAPDGTQTADTVFFDAGAGTSGDRSLIIQNVTLGAGTYSGSFYARVASGTGQLVFRQVGASTYTTANLTTSWQRFSSIETTTGATFAFEIGIRRGLSNEPINASVTVEIWGAQLEASDFGPTDYIPTTTAAVSVGPVANVPRLDYLNSSCPRLLLEPQATSLILFSEQMNNAAWAKGNVTVTANQSASPTGYSDADSLAEQAVNGIHYAGQAIASAAAGTYTFSCFLKQGTTQYGGFRAVVNGFTNRYFVLLDLSNGSVVNTNTTASGVTWTHKVDDYGNGWYRLSVTAAHTSGNIDISISTSDTATPTYFGGLPTYLGTNKFIYAWGANITATAYPQSYIPTLGAAVTRGADSASKTGISSLIGQTEGTIVLDVENNESEVNSFITLSPSATTLNNHIYLGQSAAGNLALYVRNGGTYSIIAASITSIIGIKKVALAYGPSFARIYVNGTQVYNSTAAVIPSGMDKIEINSFNTSSDIGRVSIGEALIFKTILPDSDLAALTA